MSSLPRDLDDVTSAGDLAVLSVPPRTAVLSVGVLPRSVTRALLARGCSIWVACSDADAVEAAHACHGVVVADLEEVDPAAAFDGRVFDNVLVLDALPRLRHAGLVLRRSAAALSPGGRIVAAVPNVAHGAVRLSLLRGRFPHVGTPVRLFDRQAVEELFRDAGLHVVEVLRVTRAFDADGAIDPDSFPPEVLEEVVSDPEASTYEFVVVAKREPPEGTEIEERTVVEALQRRVSRLEDRVLQDELDLEASRLEVEHLRMDLAVKDAFIDDLRDALEEAEKVRQQQVGDLEDRVSGHAGEIERLTEVQARLRYRVVDRFHDALQRRPLLYRRMRQVARRIAGGR